jgi:hypothetical protein
MGYILYIKNKVACIEILLRFGIGWHPDTNQLWAYITPGKRHEYSGRGYYITLSQYILGSIKDSGKLFVYKVYVYIS